MMYEFPSTKFSFVKQLSLPSYGEERVCGFLFSAEQAAFTHLLFTLLEFQHIISLFLFPPFGCNGIH